MKDIHINRHFQITLFHTAFRFSWGPDFAFDGERHSYWELVYIERGQVISTEDEKIYSLGAGQMILHAPMEFHRIRSAENSSPAGMILSFLVDGTLPEEIKNGVFRLRESERDEFHQIFDRISICTLPDASPYAAQQAADLLAVFLIRLGQETADCKLSVLVSAEEYRHIVSDMTQCVCDNLTLSEIADKHNISVSYLKLLFKTYAGISPKSYYNTLRISHAAHLLLQSPSVAYVAEQMNFSSIHYFTVFFQKHTGLSPSEYRKNNHPL